MEGDNRSEETRLVLLEEGLKRVEMRLNVVSDRTHNLGNAVQNNTNLQEEAQTQRTEMQATINGTKGVVDELRINVTRYANDMAHHIRECDKRGVHLIRVAYTLLIMMMSVIGFLVTRVIEGFK